METFWKWIDRVIVAINGGVILIAVLHIAADVTLKYLILMPVAGTIVYVSKYYMVSLVYLSLVVVTYRDQHIKVDLFTLPFGPRFERFQDRLVSTLSAVICAMLAAATWKDAVRAYNDNEYALEQSSTISIWPGYFLLPIGFALMAALLVTKVIWPAMATAKPIEEFADV